MIVKVYAEPSLEPVDLASLRTHLGIDSGTVASDMTPYTSIAAGSHPVVTAYTLLGTAVEVLGHTAIVYLRPTNNGAGATVDAKVQECDTTNGTWTDWATGAFTQVTEATDTAIQEISYTGVKKYVRVAAKTLVNACEFSSDVMVWEPNVSEDSMLTELITAGRISVENDTSRKIMEQTIDYYPKRWPSGDRIKIPFGNLSNETGKEPIVKWKDDAGTETTMVVNTDYIVETNGDQCGFIVLPDDGQWPSEELYVSKPISIRFVCGYATQAAVPISVKRAIKAACANLYMNRGDDVIGQTVSRDVTYSRLVNMAGRLHDMDFI
jgi:uncharacterized phiE125 gp8 family phage protein